MKLWIGVVVVVVGCGSKSEPENTERYAVGTYLFTGSMLTGASDCKFEAPPGVLDGSMILKPGTIKESCPSGHTETIVAEYADHVTLTFPKTAKVGEKVSFRFELRNAKDQQLTKTLSQAGETTLGDGCVALTNLGREGAQDTGRDPFMSATAAAAGTCKVSVDIELPTATGPKKLHAEQDVTVQ